jgi:hypothetical protein
MLTQWYDICAIIGGVFLGFTTMLILVVYLEQWLARPDPRSLGAIIAELQLAQPDGSARRPWAPDLSIEAGVSYLRRTKAPGFDPDPQGARLSVNLFTRLPPNIGDQ